jgi:class 3 adenylate cyclase/tetratricopeptide (TPR) repeat protein
MSVPVLPVTSAPDGPDGVLLCPVCSTANGRAARFCGTCGTRLLFFCWSCGTEASVGQQFCRTCGTALAIPATGLLPAAGLPAGGGPLALTTAAVRTPPPRPIPSPPEHVPAPLGVLSTPAEFGAGPPVPGNGTPVSPVGEEHEDDNALVEERRFVSVLFADIVGFTTLAERLDPEDVRELSAAVLARLAEAVALYGGTIDKFMGDAIMALFGAPVAHEDDPVRAVHAAIAMHQAVASLNQLDREGNELELRLRIGVNSGEVIAGVRDVGGHREYSVFGDVVNTAARLQTAAEPGSTLLGELTARQAGSVFELASIPPLALKGKAQLVPAYAVRGHLAREMPSLSGGTTLNKKPLVGRLQELQELRRHVGDLSRGRGQLLSVIGDHGVGKSRLLGDVREYGEELGLYWVEVAAPSHAQGLSYRLIREVVPRLLGLRSGVSEARLAEALAERLARLGLGDLAPPLGLVLGAESDAEETAGLTAQQIQWRVVDALRRLLGVLTIDRPLVLLLDSLQWADSSSIDVLVELMALTDEAPVLFVYVFTPEPDAPSWQLKEQAARSFPHRYAELVLGPLSDQAARELMCSLLSCSETPAQVEALVLERTDGNPFFIEEVLRALIDSGTLRLDGDRWIADREINVLQVPQTLVAGVQARIDRLPAGVRRTLQVAAMIGREVSERVLRRVLDGGPELDRHLREALRAGLLREEAVIPERRYVFTQALIQEAAASSLLLRRRREIHVQIGWALEEVYADNLEEQYGELARHFWEGESWERAFRYSRLAAEQAAAAYANDEAIAAFTIALESAERSAAGASPAVVAMLAERRADIRSVLGRYDAALEDYKAAIVHYVDELEDRNEATVSRQLAVQVGALALKMARLYSYTGDVESTRDKLQAAFKYLPDGSPELASAWALKAALYTWASDAVSGAEAGRRALQLAQERGSFRHLAEAYEALTHPSMMGELGDELLTFADDWIAAARARPEERPVLFKALTARGLVKVWARWTFDEADRADMLEAIEIARSTGSTVGETTARGILGIGEMLVGEWDAAESDLRRSIGLPTTIVGVGAIFEWWLMLLLTLRGDIEAACDQMDTWLSTGQNTHRAVLMTALRGLNRLRAGDDEMAREAIAEAKRAAGQLGCAQCSLTMEMLGAEVRAELGDAVDAAEHAARARELGGKHGRQLAVLSAERADAILALRDDGAVERARDHLDRAIAIADGLGQPYELARTMLLQAELRDAEHDPEAAAHYRERAWALLTALGVRPGTQILRTRSGQPLLA